MLDPWIESDQTDRYTNAHSDRCNLEHANCPNRNRHHFKNLCERHFEPVWALSQAYLDMSCYQYSACRLRLHDLLIHWRPSSLDREPNIYWFKCIKCASIFCNALTIESRTLSKTIHTTEFGTESRLVSVDKTTLAFDMRFETYYTKYFKCKRMSQSCIQACRNWKVAKKLHKASSSTLSSPLLQNN